MARVLQPNTDASSGWAIGDQLGCSSWMRVNQKQIDAFGEVTEDLEPLHNDPSWCAKNSPYRQPIAYGFLTLSLLTHLIETTFSFAERKMGVNYGLNKVRFTAPLRSGSRIRARFRLAAWEKIEGGAQVTWGVTVECEGADKPVLIAEWIGRQYW